LKRRRALGCLLSSLAASAGCTSPGTANVERGFDPARAGSSVVVFSGTVTDGFVSAFWYQIESATGRDRPAVSVPVTGAGIALDWSGAGKDGATFSGRLAVVELPAGTHVLRRAVGTQGGVGVFGLPLGDAVFRTEPGEVLYLGSLQATLSATGPARRVVARIDVVDERGRDIAIMRKARGAALADRARVALLAFTQASDGGSSRRETTLDELKGLIGK
jgi:hypothetical protein